MNARKAPSACSCWTRKWQTYASSMASSCRPVRSRSSTPLLSASTSRSTFSGPSGCTPTRPCANPCSPGRCQSLSWWRLRISRCTGLSGSESSCGTSMPSAPSLETACSWWSSGAVLLNSSLMHFWVSQVYLNTGMSNVLQRLAPTFHNSPLL